MEGDKMEPKGLPCSVSFTWTAWLPQILWQLPTLICPLPWWQAFTRTHVSQGPAATASKDEGISKDIALDLRVKLPWIRRCNPKEMRGEPWDPCCLWVMTLAKTQTWDTWPQVPKSAPGSHRVPEWDSWKPVSSLSSKVRGLGQPPVETAALAAQFPD